MGRRRKTNFEESLFANMRTYGQYMAILRQIAISMFEWKNLPNSVEARYLEIALFYDGAGIYFNDEVEGNLALNIIFHKELL